MKSIKYLVKNIIAAYNDTIEEPFEYYEVEKYNNKTDIDYSSFPASIILGGLNFFLQAGNKLQIDSLIYLDPLNLALKPLMTILKHKKTQSNFITAGCTHYTNSVNIPSYK